MYQVIWIVEIWLGTRRSSAHANTAQIALSMCSSRYFPLLPLFFLCFWLSLFFWDSLIFSFYFFYIFPSLRSTKQVTIENMSLNKWKTWPVEISEDVLKNDKKLVTTKRWSCDQFFTKIKIFDSKKTRDGWIQIFFLIDFDIWNVEIRVRMRKLDQF